MLSSQATNELSFLVCPQTDTNSKLLVQLATHRPKLRSSPDAPR
jgi:hypothetical protein